MSKRAVELSAKQQSHTLSAKKKKSKKFRYSLAQPFPRYWPQLTDEQSQQFLKLLQKIQIQHSEWFERKKSSNDDNKVIFCGLQASIRNLKTGKIRLLALSADLKPKYVANQIILQALACNDKIQIVCIPNLATLTQSLFSFSCYSFMITDEKWLEFSELDKWTTAIIREYFPIPSIIQAHFMKRSANKANPMEVDEPQLTKQTLINACERPIEVSDLHLTRDSCQTNQRAFVPKNAINLKPIALEIESLNKIKSDFISLDTYDTAADASSQRNFHKNPMKNRKRPLTLYRELTVNKIQSNPNKVKKFKHKKDKNKNNNKNKK